MFTKKYTPKRAIKNNILGSRLAGIAGMLLFAALWVVFSLGQISPRAYAENTEAPWEEVTFTVELDARANASCDNNILVSYATDPENLQVQFFWKINAAEWESLEAEPRTRTLTAPQGSAVVFRIVPPEGEPVESDPLTVPQCATASPTPSATVSPSATPSPSAPAPTKSVTPDSSPFPGLPKTGV